MLARLDPLLLPSFYPGASLALDFVQRRFRVAPRAGYSQVFSALPGASITRSTVGYAPDSGGVLRLFQPNQARITDLGLLVEEARTNVALWSRDLTNAAWVKVNMTAALDQTGPDLTVNGASSITATSASATILQTITLASSARFQTAYVKRLTGSGTVNMTTDGVTWTAVTVTSSWTRVSIPTQTLANPIIGFQIITSGDAIAVDFVQNENGAFATSPSATTTVAVQRALDLVIVAGLTLPASFTMLASTTTPNADGVLLITAEFSDGTTNNRFSLRRATTNSAQLLSRSNAGTNDVVSDGAVTGAMTMTVAGRFDSGTIRVAANGSLAAADIAATAPLGLTVLSIGSATGGNPPDGFVSRIVLYPRAFSNAELTQVTL